MKARAKTKPPEPVVRLRAWGRPTSSIEPAKFYAAGQRAKLAYLKGLDE